MPLKSKIEAKIREGGGTPDDEGTMLALAHRVLMKQRDVVSKGDVAGVDEGERGEDHIKAKFEKGDTGPAAIAVRPPVRRRGSAAREGWPRSDPRPEARAVRQSLGDDAMADAFTDYLTPLASVEPVHAEELAVKLAKAPSNS